MFLVNSIKSDHDDCNILNVEIHGDNIILIATPFSLIEKEDIFWLSLATIETGFFGAFTGSKRKIEVIPSNKIDFSNSYSITNYEFSLTKKGTYSVNKNLFVEHDRVGEMSDVPFYLSDVPGKYTIENHNNSIIIGNILKNNYKDIVIKFN